MANIQLELQKLANANTAKTFEFNRKEAATSRNWQEQMSNTAHQREVADLKAAGLNPVLSSGGSGAAAYSTSSASAVADSAVSALGNLESTKIAANATKYAAKQNKKAAEISAKINSAATMYAANQSSSASRYGTDHSKYGFLTDIVDGLFGIDSGSQNSGKKAGSTAKKVGKKLFNKIWKGFR